MDPVTIAGIVLIVILSITSHEAAHGFVADRLGDSTARRLGRLTLNPIPHIDPFFTVLLPAMLVLSGASFIFGGAKPVPVDVSRLRAPRRDWAFVGAAGPLTNILIATLLCAALATCIHGGLLVVTSRGTAILSVGIFVNVLLAIFNLIPIPPLDGSRVAQYFLSPRALAGYRRLEQFGLLLTVVLIFYVRPVRIVLSALIFSSLELLTRLFGIWPHVASVLRSVL